MSELPREMTAARLHGIGDVRLHTEPVPVPAPGEVLLRIGSVGLCGSDLHWFTEGGIGATTLERPVIPGHEFGGTIAAGPEAGLRVAVDPAVPCGHCPQCEEGYGNLCPAVKFAGHGALDGPLAQFLAWPRSRCVPVPDALSDDDVALLEPLGVALHAHDHAHVRAGEDVAVVGCGPIGLFLISLARATGAGRIVAVEPLAHRREAALARGADVVLDPGTGDMPDGGTPAPLPVSLAAGLADALPGGAHRVFEVCGEPMAVAAAIHAARPGGRVMLVGIPGRDETVVPASEARRKGLTLALSRRMGEVYPRAIDLVARGVVDLAGMVTASLPLAEAGRAFETAAARDGLKVTIRPNA